MIICMSDDAVYEVEICSVIHQLYWWEKRKSFTILMITNKLRRVCIIFNVKLLGTPGSQATFRMSLVSNSHKNFQFFFFLLCWKMSGKWRQIIFNHDFFLYVYLPVCLNTCLSMCLNSYTHDNLRTKSPESSFLC